MTEFTERVVKAISGIPKGKVATYGRIAVCAGSPSGARQVVRILNSMTGKFDLPWHRVVNREGYISLPPGGGYELQKTLLEKEGIEFREDGKIDLSKYLWKPGDPE